MNWLLIAITAHFIAALVFVVDKYILNRERIESVVYAFYIGLLRISVLLLIPFGFSVLPVNQILISFSAGILFILATVFFYHSIKISEVSKVAPIVGGTIPISVLLLSYVFLGERLSENQLFAFFLLVLGGVIILLRRKGDQFVIGKKLTKVVLMAVLSGFLFALSFALTKYIFTRQPFINGLIWIQLGSFLGAWLLLLWPPFRKEILSKAGGIRPRVGGMIVLNKVLSAGGFILLNYAIFLGSVSLVNALQGVQYVFLLILGIFLSRKLPQIVKEQINRRVIIQKSIAIVLIGIGLMILAFENGVF